MVQKTVSTTALILGGLFVTTGLTNLTVHADVPTKTRPTSVATQAEADSINQKAQAKYDAAKVSETNKLANLKNKQTADEAAQSAENDRDYAAKSIAASQAAASLAASQAATLKAHDSTAASQALADQAKASQDAHDYKQGQITTLNQATKDAANAVTNNQRAVTANEAATAAQQEAAAQATKDAANQAAQQAHDNAVKSAAEKQTQANTQADANQRTADQDAQTTEQTAETNAKNKQSRADQAAQNQKLTADKQSAAEQQAADKESNKTMQDQNATASAEANDNNQSAAASQKSADSVAASVYAQQQSAAKSAQDQNDASAEAKQTSADSAAQVKLDKAKNAASAALETDNASAATSQASAKASAASSATAEDTAASAALSDDNAKASAANATANSQALSAQASADAVALATKSADDQKANASMAAVISQADQTLADGTKAAKLKQRQGIDSSYQVAVDSAQAALSAAQAALDVAGTAAPSTTGTATSTITSTGNLPTTLADPKTVATNGTYYTYDKTSDTSAHLEYDLSTTKGQAQNKELGDYAFTLINAWRATKGMSPITWTDNTQTASFDVMVARNGGHGRKKNGGDSTQKSILNLTTLNDELNALGLKLNYDNELITNSTYAWPKDSDGSNNYLIQPTMLKIKVDILNNLTDLLYNSANANYAAAQALFGGMNTAIGFAAQRNTGSDTDTLPYLLLFESYTDLNGKTISNPNDTPLTSTQIIQDAAAKTAALKTARDAAKQALTAAQSKQVAAQTALDNETKHTLETLQGDRDDAVKTTQSENATLLGHNQTTYTTQVGNHQKTYDQAKPLNEQAYNEKLTKNKDAYDKKVQATAGQLAQVNSDVDAAYSKLTAQNNNTNKQALNVANGAYSAALKNDATDLANAKESNREKAQQADQAAKRIYNQTIEDDAAAYSKQTGQNNAAYQKQVADNLITYQADQAAYARVDKEQVAIHQATLDGALEQNQRDADQTIANAKQALTKAYQADAAQHTAMLGQALSEYQQALLDANQAQVAATDLASQNYDQQLQTDAKTRRADADKQMTAFADEQAHQLAGLRNKLAQNLAEYRAAQVVALATATTTAQKRRADLVRRQKQATVTADRAADQQLAGYKQRLDVQYQALIQANQLAYARAAAASQRYLDSLKPQFVFAAEPVTATSTAPVTKPVVTTSIVPIVKLTAPVTAPNVVTTKLVAPVVTQPVIKPTVPVTVPRTLTPKPTIATNPVALVTTKLVDPVVTQPDIEPTEPVTVLRALTPKPTITTKPVVLVTKPETNAAIRVTSPVKLVVAHETSAIIPVVAKPASVTATLVKVQRHPTPAAPAKILPRTDEATNRTAASAGMVILAGLVGVLTLGLNIKLRRN